MAIQINPYIKQMDNIKAKYFFCLRKMVSFILMPMFESAFGENIWNHDQNQAKEQQPPINIFSYQKN